MPKFHNDIVLTGTSRIRNVPTVPGSGTDAVNRDYVEARFADLNQKDNVFVAPPGNVNISSPGGTLDSQTMTSANPRVGLFFQTAAAQNGIYDWNGPSVPMTRSLDANTFDGLRNARTVVDTGTNAGVIYRQTALTGTLGTTPLVWQTETGSAPTASTVQSGISRHATQSEVDAGAALSPNVVATPDTVFSASWRVRSKTAVIGDGSTLTFDVLHNLNAEFPVVQCRLTSGDKAVIHPDITWVDNNTQRVSFAAGAAPATNGVRVVVVAGPL